MEQFYIAILYSRFCKYTIYILKYFRHALITKLIIGSVLTMMRRVLYLIIICLRNDHRVRHMDGIQSHLLLFNT